ncbi:hypothetical protein CAPTEDRAFT_175607 [Capitella teleta]|uniref:Zinc transporter ZIP11 n=1 Tax=Capitella teleta TaxID=283909 RepID=R7VKS0_CAPTE|nr:hypothetical protein CAPTEDRAFT_175607 [Capitella teleta]|eukprot:ELU17005.1 hypothetical protein CAPTEDRAFT_175607 [Capitella teleta]
MIAGCHPVLQALLGTLFTWGLTGAGSALVFVFSSGKRKILDGSLGFAAGVMTAASYWSLLAPAIEMAENSGYYGANGEWAFVPVAIGFALGAAFVYWADKFVPLLVRLFGSLTDASQSLETSSMLHRDAPEDIVDESARILIYYADSVQGTARRRGANPSDVSGSPLSLVDSHSKETERSVSWKRILLLIVAITIHNIPEGLAVGVGFGAIGKSATATFENARNLAIGIGIQNFPEGLAVSLPLRGSGMGIWRSFWYGQLSGMVEPIAGVFGALAVVVAEPILPYALAFAAGAMIYVVLDDIVPEAQMWYSLK